MGYHNKANPTPKEIEGELASQFPTAFEKDEKFLADCVALSHFLSTPLATGLDTLEKQLQNTVGLELGRVLDHYRNRSEGLTGDVLDAKLRHLLSREMTRRELECGFSLFSCTGEHADEYPDGKAATFAGFLQPDQFRNQVELGRHWKDPGVPGLHGEYTHRIQWYLMIDGLKPLFGKEAPVKLFQRIGSVVNKDDSSTGLWDALFDRETSDVSPFRVASNVTDFRSPESFTAYVTDDLREKTYPILHWFIKARLKKRGRAALNNYGSSKEYVQRKIDKFGLQKSPEDVIGTWRQFSKSLGERVIEPGKLIASLDQ